MVLMVVVVVVCSRPFRESLGGVIRMLLKVRSETYLVRVGFRV